MINFISNLPPTLRTGGFSAMNATAHDALSSRYSLNCVAPVNPGINYLDKAISKYRRALGGRGAYYFYSADRLSAIASEVRDRSSKAAHLDYFHGFTPWISVKPDRPYVASSDCTFKDYVSIYNHGSSFRRSDLERIENQEAQWLRSANAVIFSSHWAANRAQWQYGLDPLRVHVVPPLGELAGNGVDQYSGGLSFAFISTNFTAKGGPAVINAFQALQKKYPDIRLLVVGDSPSGSLSGQGIEYLGYLRKEIDEEREKLVKIFTEARGIVNCSSADISPILLVEAASYGCPVVSTNRFAIPEIVANGTTGFLVDHGSDLAEAMESLLVDECRYLAMRKSALEASKTLNSTQRFQQQLCTIVDTFV